MAVVIHELEVVPQEKPAAGGGPTAAPAEKPKSGGVGVLDVRRVERLERHRGLRVWAH